MVSTAAPALAVSVVVSEDVRHTRQRKPGEIKVVAVVVVAGSQRAVHFHGLPDHPQHVRRGALLLDALEELAELFARDVARRAPPAERIEVLGPAEAPLAIIRGRYRWRLLIKAPRELDVQAYLRSWLDTLPKPPADLRLTVDIDPYNFL